MQRPGKIRFDYAPPSALRIVADGIFLAIEDSDLKTVEKYPIQSTPFRLLLSDAVDLGRDARIVGVESQEGTLAISLEDKSGDAAGSIRLVFDSGSRAPVEAVGDHRRARLDDAGERHRHRLGAKGRGRLLHLEGQLPAFPLRQKRVSGAESRRGTALAEPSGIEGKQS